MFLITKVQKLRDQVWSWLPGIPPWICHCNVMYIYLYNLLPGL